MPRMVSIRAGLWNRESASFIDDGIVNLSRSKTCEVYLISSKPPKTKKQPKTPSPIAGILFIFTNVQQEANSRLIFNFINAGNSTVEEKQAPYIEIGTRNINNNREKSKEALIGHSNFKAKLVSSSLATDEKCVCGKWTQFSITFLTVRSLKRILEKIIGSYPLFPSYEISVTEHDIVSGSTWFPVDAAGVSAAIRHCGYVSRGKTARNSLLEFWVFPRTVAAVPQEANDNVGTYVVCKTINLYLLTPWSA
ncbi:hypothetical protein HZH68_007311 [Vespula germanica]|uniref:Uncharacterized protein n=1 Tax=Vespula germanica TaxID=30212 RepID=A0A834KCS5_VESGE|nr:hypothetical protein HZH68_007311 [Vespula germanica]